MASVNFPFVRKDSEEPIVPKRKFVELRSSLHTKLTTKTRKSSPYNIHAGTFLRAKAIIRTITSPESLRLSLQPHNFPEKVPVVLEFCSSMRVSLLK